MHWEDRCLYFEDDSKLLIFVCMCDFLETIKNPKAKVTDMNMELEFIFDQKSGFI